LLGKRRTAFSSDVDEVLIPFSWDADRQPPDIMAEELPQYSSNDEDSPSVNINNISLDHQLAPIHHEHTLRTLQLLDGEEIIATPSMHEQDTSPEVAYSDALVPFNYVRHDNEHTYGARHDSLAEHEQYMVLYNGNAEVVGNFRALNFYKASDINIKEDVRLLMEDDDPRGILLQIDGVSYKFRPGTTHSTQRRFVGYIAQQIESVVPSAVQLIDGILHVDYESLIPYLSESIKQNFNDIKNNKRDTQKIHDIVDSLFTEFTKFKKDSNEPSQPRKKWVWWVVALSLLAVVIAGTIIGTLTILNNHDPSVQPSPTDSVPTSANQTETFHHDWREFFTATNGNSWTNNSGWMTNASICSWHGVTCDGSGSVTKLDLHDNNLTGTIPITFASLLANITDLDLSTNYLRGSIPSNFGTLQKLSRLVLKRNNLQGQVPLFAGETAGVIALQYIDLSSNQLSGTIPHFDKMYIDVLDLSSNLLEGTIPKISTTLVSTINLSHNKLSGEGHLYYMLSPQQFNISHNEFTGEFWVPFVNSIQAFDISHNKFTGFGGLMDGSDIPYCDASQNDFYCPIPAWLKEHCGATCKNF
jgi:hypothetical protein